MSENNSDPAEIYKQLEKEYNQTLLSMLNNQKIIVQFGKVLNAHLDEVVFNRRIAEGYLNMIHLPAKSEFANLAKAVIRLEHKADELEDYLSSLRVDSESYANIMNKHFNEMNNLGVILETEFQFVKPKPKLQLLKEELEGLLATL